MLNVPGLAAGQEPESADPVAASLRPGQHQEASTHQGCPPEAMHLLETQR